MLDRIIANLVGNLTPDFPDFSVAPSGLTTG
jgi:hypothetical protein